MNRKTFIICFMLALSLLAVESGRFAYAMSTDYYEMDDNAIYHFRKAEIWIEVEKYEAAIREFQIAIRLNPTTAMTADLYNNLGLTYVKIGRFSEAIVSLQKAIELNSGFSLYYENLVKVYKKSNEVETAVRELSRRIGENPGATREWYLLGLLKRASGNITGGNEALKKYIELAPKSQLADAARSILE